jgi:1,4-dihydroxy-2-naphthoyl-CoA hydrolase
LGTILLPRGIACVKHASFLQHLKTMEPYAMSKSPVTNNQSDTRADLFLNCPGLDAINALSQNSLGERLGMEITEVGVDFLRGRMPVDERTRQPFGLLHGGASVALAETLGSLAGQLCVPPDRMVVGLEINANHVRGVRSGYVVGTARALHIGGRTQVWEIRIEDEGAELVCVSRITLAVIAKSPQDRT